MTKIFEYRTWCTRLSVCEGNLRYASPCQITTFWQCGLQHAQIWRKQTSGTCWAEQIRTSHSKSEAKVQTQTRVLFLYSVLFVLFRSVIHCPYSAWKAQCGFTLTYISTSPSTSALCVVFGFARMTPCKKKKCFENDNLCFCFVFRLFVMFLSKGSPCSGTGDIQEKYVSRHNEPCPLSPARPSTTTCRARAHTPQIGDRIHKGELLEVTLGGCAGSVRIRRVEGKSKRNVNTQNSQQGVVQESGLVLYSAA